MKITINEHLDRDPTYRGLVAQRDHLERVISEQDSRTEVRYWKFLDQIGRLTSKIGEYERTFASPDLDSSSIDIADIEAIVPVVIGTNKELKHYFAKHPEALYDLAPRKFEMLIADILQDLGFEVSWRRPHMIVGSTYMLI